MPPLLAVLAVLAVLTALPPPSTPTTAPCIPPAWASPSYLVDPTPPATPAAYPPQHLPAIANGYLGRLPWSSSLFVAGLYSGRSFSTPSHRARIPPPTAFNVSSAASSPPLVLCATALDTATGTFYARYVWPSVPGPILESFLLAPRSARHAIISGITAAGSPPPPSSPPLTISLTPNPGPPSADLIALPSPSPLAPCPFLALAQINETETPSSPRTRLALCASRLPASVAWADLAAAPAATLPFYTVAATSLEFPGSDAQLAAEAAALAAALAPLHDQHWLAPAAAANAAAWADLWASRIDVVGDDTLDAALAASLFAIYSAVHDDWPWAPTPTGLVWNGYDGLVFWDSGVWMMPSLVVLNPPLAAHTCLAYRAARLGAAQAKAASYGFAGAMFPWQSGLTGVETTPYPPNPEGRYEQHISGDIVIAFRLYFWATLDRAFMAQPPVLDLVLDVARFWTSRLVPVPHTPGLLGVYNVQPPDESAGIVNNSVYTNAVAGQAIEFAAALAALLDSPIPVPSTWANISASIYLPFDPALGIHLEYAGYAGEDINQADVALLQYPLGLAMPRDVATADLEYYAARTRQNGYFTGDSSYSNAWLRLGNVSAAAPMYQAAFAHIAPPFLVWQEKLVGGHSNFITGAGGFVQNILFGYLGLDVHGPGAATITPRLPPRAAATPPDTPGATALTFRRLWLGGVAYAATYTRDTLELTWLAVSPPGSTIAVTLLASHTALGTLSAASPTLKAPIAPAGTAFGLCTGLCLNEDRV